MIAAKAACRKRIKVLAGSATLGNSHPQPIAA
jgi:hypothetical protein